MNKTKIKTLYEAFMIQIKIDNKNNYINVQCSPSP